MMKFAPPQRPAPVVQRQDEEEKTRFAPMDFGGGQPAAGGPQSRQPEPTVVAPMELQQQQQAPRARPAAGAPPPMGQNPCVPTPKRRSSEHDLWFPQPADALTKAPTWLRRIGNSRRADLFEFRDHGAGVVMRHDMARTNRNEISGPHHGSRGKSISVPCSNLFDER